MLLQDFFSFLVENRTKFLELTLEHIGLTFLSIFLAILLAVPGGILASRRDRLAAPLLGFAGIMQTVPSIALLGFLLPFLGIGIKPAIVALFLYALLPIIRNTYTGIKEVSPVVKEAARGMGLTNWQILSRVELPLAMPVIIAGIRTATVINVGVATLAAYIGAGGLGEFIFSGIALNNTLMIMAGALPSALLALLLDQLLGLLQKVDASRLARLSRGMVGVFLLVAGFFVWTGMTDPRIPAAFEPEYSSRADGLPKLESVYGLQFDAAILNQALMYQAVARSEVDVISGYSTDARIKTFDLVILEDDQKAFPPYYCSLITREEFAENHPELIDALNLLAGRINDSTMIELNYQVDHEKRSPESVAKEYLQGLELWKPDRKKGGKKIRLASKIFTEQYILCELFAQLIDGYTDFDTDIRPGLGGTKLCFDALRKGEIDLYPEYTGTGFQVLLSPPEDSVNILVKDADGIFNYVDREFRAQYGLEWLPPLGFNNTYAIMVRRSFAEQNELSDISDLLEL